MKTGLENDKIDGTQMNQAQTVTTFVF